MGIRKGQFIVNYLHSKLKIPEERVGGYLFAMLDEDFEEMEHEYRKFIITKIHDPKEWDESLKLGREFVKEQKRRSKTAS